MSNLTDKLNELSNQGIKIEIQILPQHTDNVYVFGLDTASPSGDYDPGHAYTITSIPISEPELVTLLNTIQSHCIAYRKLCTTPSRDYYTEFKDAIPQLEYMKTMVDGLMESNLNDYVKFNTMMLVLAPLNLEIELCADRDSPCAYFEDYHTLCVKFQECYNAVMNPYLK